MELESAVAMNENSVNVNDNRKTENEVKAKKDHKLVVGIATLILGLATLAIGIVMLVIALNRQPDVQDAEYLVSVESWQREDAPSVIWRFTEVGSGTLTTNAHQNDYNFIWALEGDQLKIETEWLYDLDDEYNYKIEGGKLILNDKITFIPVVATE